MLGFPPPEPAALELSEQLQAKIRQRILTKGGSISFANFMHMALYEPGLGYYSAGSAKFGSAGDFITAPETSSLFGRCFARQIHQVFQELDQKIILEFGAGSGRLACDVLKELEKLHALPDTYLILEVSADLRERQQQLIKTQLPHLMDKVEWLDSLPDEKFSGVVLANEILDAMPIERFQITAEGIQEQQVTFDSGQFSYTNKLASNTLITAVESICVDLPLGYTSEINRSLPAWFNGISNSLSCGVIFCVDYGYTQRDYYHPERINGTLICHYRHRSHDDPFFAIGLQDLSASVDFTSTADAAFNNGLSVAGYTTQAMFLLACGLTELLEDEKEHNPEQYLLFSQQAKTLTLPAEMGEPFKVIGLTKQLDIPLLGFEINDMLDRL